MRYIFIYIDGKFSRLSLKNGNNSARFSTQFLHQIMYNSSLHGAFSSLEKTFSMINRYTAEQLKVVLAIALTYELT